MMQIGQTYFLRFLKYVWPFYNIMHGRIKVEWKAVMLQFWNNLGL